MMKVSRDFSKCRGDGPQEQIEEEDERPRAQFRKEVKGRCGLSFHRHQEATIYRGLSNEMQQSACSAFDVVCAVRALIAADKCILRILHEVFLAVHVSKALFTMEM